MNEAKMNKELLKRIKDIQDIDFSNPEEQKEVLNLLETLFQIIIEQAQEIQRLKDEINKMKGEKGKPKYEEKEKEGDKTEDKKGMETGEKKNWNKGKKADKIK